MLRILLNFFIVAAILTAGCGQIGSLKKVTKAKYNSVQSGMSYSQVVAIIGCEGEENANTTIDGIPGIMPQMTTKMYSWINFDGSNMNAMFQNDMLINKAQFGLK